MLIAPDAVLIAGNQALFITTAGSVFHAFGQGKGLFYLPEISFKDHGGSALRTSKPARGNDGTMHAGQQFYRMLFDYYFAHKWK